MIHYFSVSYCLPYMPFLFVYVVCLCHHYSNVYHATHLTIFVYVNYKLCIVIILKFDYFTIHYILITKVVKKTMSKKHKNSMENKSWTTTQENIFKFFFFLNLSLHQNTSIINPLFHELKHKQHY